MNDWYDILASLHILLMEPSSQLVGLYTSNHLLVAFVVVLSSKHYQDDLEDSGCYTACKDVQNTFQVSLYWHGGKQFLVLFFYPLAHLDDF